MSREKILILSSSHLSRNPRVVKEATSLGAAGYDVTVMSISAHPAFEKLDRDLAAGLPFQRAVLDLASSDRTTRLRRFLSRGNTWLARVALRYFHFESARALGPAGPLLHLARKFPAALTIVHTEIPLWSAQYLVHDGRRVAVDMEDWYSEDLMFADRRTRPLRLLRAAERFALSHTAYTSATSTSMATALAETYGCPLPLVIRNTFPLQSAPLRTERRRDELPAFIWFSQTIGPGRGLELFFAAWSITTVPSRVFLVGEERAGYRAHILKRLPPNRRGLVTFLPSVPPQSLPAELIRFDIGLALEPSWPRNRDLTISNKIFQYLNAGLAVVATDTAGQSEVMRAAPDSGLLIQAHETTRNAGLLDQLIGNRHALRACQLASRSAAETLFNWEKDSLTVLAAVERALSSTPSVRF